MSDKSNKVPSFEEERRMRRKKALVKALGKTQGLISLACEKAKVSRDFYYDNYKIDPVFRKACDEIIEKQKDLVEATILTMISAKDGAMCRWYADRKMRDRGYVTKLEITRPNPKKSIDLTKFPPELVAELEKTLFNYEGESDNE
jgi:hypothetical protein